MAWLSVFPHDVTQVVNDVPVEYAVQGVQKITTVLSYNNYYHSLGYTDYITIRLYALSSRLTCRYICNISAYLTCLVEHTVLFSYFNTRLIGSFSKVLNTITLLIDTLHVRS